MVIGCVISAGLLREGAAPHAVPEGREEDLRVGAVQVQVCCARRRPLRRRAGPADGPDDGDAAARPLRQRRRPKGVRGEEQPAELLGGRRRAGAEPLRGVQGRAKEFLHVLNYPQSHQPQAAEARPISQDNFPRRT